LISFSWDQVGSGRSQARVGRGYEFVGVGGLLWLYCIFMIFLRLYNYGVELFYRGFFFLEKGLSYASIIIVLLFFFPFTLGTLEDMHCLVDVEKGCISHSVQESNCLSIRIWVCVSFLLGVVSEDCPDEYHSFGAIYFAFLLLPRI
jgi:hypothetical protein